jgi:hypothetical protein
MKNKYSTRHITNLDEKEIREICEEYKQNRTTKEICSKHNIGRTGLCKLLHKENIPRKKRRIDTLQITKLPWNDVLKDYESEMGCDVLGKKYGVTPGVIKYHLHKNGIQMRSRGTHKYKFDKGYFKNMCQQTAYWLGDSYADIYLSGTRYRIIFRVAIKDKELLQSFLNSIKLKDYVIREKYVKNEYKLNNKRTPQCYITINSKEMWLDLVCLGCTPDKTKRMKLPTLNQIPEKFMSDFILGFSDGDGWWSKHKNKSTKNGFSYSWGFCGNYQFVKELREYMVRRCDLNRNKISRHKKLFVVCWSGNIQLSRIWHFLYDNHTGYCLERKKTVFQNMVINDPTELSRPPFGKKSNTLSAIRNNGKRNYDKWLNRWMSSRVTKNEHAKKTNYPRVAFHSHEQQ